MVEHDGSCTGSEETVVFRLPIDLGGDRVQVLGDWNEWSAETAAVMERCGDQLVTAVRLERGRAYGFRYLVDGEHWKNDPDADDYRRNGFGGYDSVVDLREQNS